MDTQNSTADEDEDGWHAIIGLRTGNSPEEDNHLRIEAPEFHPDNDMTQEGEEHDTDDDTMPHVAPEAEAPEDRAEKVDGQDEVLSESSSSDQENPVDTPAKQYPFRLRKKRVIFTYDKLGVPSTSSV
uniref:Uncharacterized protein n=1 Tax=Knipowitschia caucasica TaxID=637954 RepID=A0AAV2JHX0_KNICA